MPLGESIRLTSEINNQEIQSVVRPVQISSRWATLIDAGGMDDADAGAATRIVTPSTQITDSTRKIVQTGQVGTLLILQLKYEDDTTAATSPIVQVFGKTDDSEHWIMLVNRDGEDQITMTVAASNDVTDGTYKYTAIDPDKHMLDLMGCTQILVGVHTAGSFTNGDDALAELLGKLT